MVAIAPAGHLGPVPVPWTTNIGPVPLPDWWKWVDPLGIAPDQLDPLKGLAKKVNPQGKAGTKGADGQDYTAGLSAHGSLIQLLVEFVAVAALILLAGTSRRGADLALVIVVTLWAVFGVVRYGG